MIVFFDGKGMLDRKIYQEERQRHLTYLNTVLGGFAFTIALACLSLKESQLALLIASPIIGGLALIGYKIFPESIRRLREHAKHDAKAKELSDHIDSEHYSYGSMLRDLFPYCYGYGFYVMALIFTDYFKGLVNP